MLVNLVTTESLTCLIVPDFYRKVYAHARKIRTLYENKHLSISPPGGKCLALIVRLSSFTQREW